MGFGKHRSREELMASTTCHEIDQSDKKVRKHWLLATVCLWGYNQLSLLFTLLDDSDWGPIPHEESLYFFSTSIVRYLIPTLLILYFAYKKHGTKFLTICLGIGMLQTIQWSKITFLNLERFHNTYFIVKAILDISIFIWWYILSFKLRSINMHLQMSKRNRPFSYLEYLKSIEELKAIETIDGVEKKFSEIMKKWPQFKIVSSKEYELKKSELSKS